MPVYPGQPGRQIAGVPVDTPRGPELTSQALLDVLNWLQVAEKDLSEEGDVGDGQTERVDLAEPLLVRKGGNVSAELLEGGVDTGAAEQGGRLVRRREGREKSLTYLPGLLCSCLLTELTCCNLTE